MTILVTGATGNVGRHLVEQLHAANRPVRALTRDPASARLPAGVDVRAGDFTDFASLEAALEGATALHLMTTFGPGNTTVPNSRELVDAAVKAGALDYLPKPADADAVERALLAREGETPEPPEDPMSADRVRWEHIQRIFELCDRNVSETARRLKMHRRTLQRILSKHAPRS